jgi:GNAT superfamily N-acetyltransferase/acyl carrier protein
VNTQAYSELRAALYAFLCEHDASLDPSCDDLTSLIESGRLDSLAVFNLVLWVEARTGTPIDPTQVDLVTEWDTVERILHFVERSTAPPTVPPLKRPRRAGTVEIVRCTPEHKDAVARFQTGLWSPDPDRNRRYFEWKHEQNPYRTDTPHVYLAQCDGEVVGMRGFYPSAWRRGACDDPCTALVADDFLLAQSHRRSGLANQLMQTACECLSERGFAYVLNLGGSPFTVRSALASGWRSIGTATIWERRAFAVRARDQALHALESAPYVWRLGARLRGRAASTEPFAAIDDRRGPIHVNRDLEVSATRAARPDEMAALAASLDNASKLRHVRDTRYFSWRLANPLRSYAYLYAYRTTLVGYVVLTHDTGLAASGRIGIADIHARNDETHTALLHALRNLALPDVYAWCPPSGRSTTRALSGFGFAPSHLATREFVITRLGATRPPAHWCMNGIPVVDPASWDMRMLDSMVA